MKAAMSRRKKTPKVFFPDMGRFNPDPSRLRNNETEALLSRSGVLYLENKPADITGGETYAHIKKELVRVFNPRDEDSGGVGIPDSPIVLYINSTGCPVDEGMALYDEIMFLRKHYKMEIHTIAQGFAMSGGALVLQAGTKRFATENSIIMIHGLQTEYGGGTMKEVENELEALRKMNSNLIKVWAKKMKIKAKDLEVELSGEDRFFTAKEALKVGLIDEIL